MSRFSMFSNALLDSLQPIALTALLALPSPGAAEVLRPGTPSGASTNRASLLPTLAHVPRVVDSADALFADAEAAARLPDLAAPDLEPVDYYAGLDDPALTRRALDVAAVTARRSRSAWDWQTLAEIALDMSLGDHDESGNSTARPDAFAREALAEIAAGAAMNGFVLAQTGGEAVSALALMVRALEEGGDSAGAGRVAHMTKGFFPDLEATAYETDIGPLLRLIDTPPRLPDVPPEDAPTPTLRAGEWLLTCSVSRDCVIQSDTDGMSLEIARAAGPGAAVSVNLVLAGSGWSNLNATPESARPEALLTVDARPLYPEAATLPFRHAPSAMEGWAWFSVPPVRLKAALDALLSGEKLTLTGHDAGQPQRADAGLHGLRVLAGVMDQRQGREGTETALVARGPKPAATVPPGPRARVFAAPVYTRPWATEPVPMSKRGQMTWQTLCQGGNADLLDAVELPGGRALHLRACPTAERPAGQAAFISRGALTQAFSTPSGEVVRWDEGFFFPATRAGVDEAPSNPAPLGLTGLVSGADYGAPCPAWESYVWTGERLTPAFVAGLTDCRASRRAAPLIRALVQEIAP